MFGITMKSWLNTNLRWSLPVGLAAAAICYSIFRRNEIQYWDGAVGNWLATILGIVTGVPVALYLERIRSTAELNVKATQAAKLRKDTLELLLGELVDALQRVETRLALTDTFPIDPMKMSIWNATRDSGNLSHISEPYLLSCIADTYRLITVLNDREKHAQTVIYGVNVTFPDGENAAQKLLRDTRCYHQPLMDQINLAINAINKALESQSNHAQ
jgi:hypothetical protein